MRAVSVVEIVDYNPRWPSLFEEEKARILDAIGNWLADSQHVGSTAVPGLAAKPIIDIALGLRNLSDGERCIAPLQALGYEYLGEAGIPGRLFFRKLTDRPDAGQTYDGVSRTHHIHMYETKHQEWAWHLVFRDYLREHEDVARQYADLKKRLAAEFGRDLEVYAEAKSEFVRSVLAKAATPK